MTDCSDYRLEEFKLENIYGGGIYLQEKCGLEKSQKLEPAKILCHKVKLMMYHFDKPQ